MCYAFGASATKYQTYRLVLPLFGLGCNGEQGQDEL